MTSPRSFGRAQRCASREMGSTSRHRTAGRTVRHGRRATAAATSPSDCAASGEQARATTFLASSAPQPIASPCAAAIPTRMPVKLPGPTPTMMRSAARREQFGDHRHETFGMAASDVLIARAQCSRRSRRTERPCRRQLDVSNARIMEAIVDTCGAKPQPRQLDGFYRFHFGHVVADEALDPPLERHR